MSWTMKNWSEALGSAERVNDAVSCADCVALARAPSAGAHAPSINARDTTQETERPEWYGTAIRISPITNKKELYYPNKIKIAKMTVSCICLGIAIIIVLMSVSGAVVYRVWVRKQVGVCESPSGLQELCLHELNATATVTSMRWRNPPAEAAAGRGGGGAGRRGEGLQCRRPDSARRPGHAVVASRATDLACQDVCWSITNGTECTNATAVIWTPDDSPNDPLCVWTGTGCVPSCPSYTTEIPCAMSRYGNSTGPLRGTCVFIDRFYVSTITAALVNLLAIVVLNGVRGQAQAGRGAQRAALSLTAPAACAHAILITRAGSQVFTIVARKLNEWGPRAVRRASSWSTCRRTQY